MVFLLGLTGNIGCGKSTVGHYLRDEFGVDYVDADRLVHRLYEPGTPETLAIAERFGTDLLQPDGTIDRRRLGDLVMADPSARSDLERLLAPGIRAVIDGALDQSVADVVVLDAIRLIEAGWHRRCQALWVVTCQAAEQQQRLVSARGLTAEQARLRIEAQHPQAEKIPFATAVIQNDGDLNALQARVREAWAQTVAGGLARG